MPGSRVPWIPESHLCCGVPCGSCTGWVKAKGNQPILQQKKGFKRKQNYVDQRRNFQMASTGGSRIFPGGVNSQSGCANLLFCKIFAENCMKKNLNPGSVPGAPWDPPMVLDPIYTERNRKFALMFLFFLWSVSIFLCVNEPLMLPDMSWESG